MTFALVSATTVSATTASASSATSSPRLISLAPHMTEAIYDLGLDAQLVAVDDHSNYPPEVLSTPRVGSGLMPNQELLLWYQPDVILGYTPNAVIEQLQSIATFEVMLSHPNTVEALFDDWRSLLALARPAPAAHTNAMATIHQAEKDWKTLQAHYIEAPKQPVFFFISAQPLYTLGGQSFLSQALAGCGAINVFADIAQPSVMFGLESLIMRQPKIIIHGYPSSDPSEPAASRQAIQKWLQRAGLRIDTAQLISVDVDILHRPTLRLMRHLPAMCEAIHGEGASIINNDSQ